MFLRNIQLKQQGFRALVTTSIYPQILFVKIRAIRGRKLVPSSEEIFVPFAIFALEND